MKFYFITIILLFVLYNSNAQFGQQQLIELDLTFATSVHSADIDGDGDLDVISASFGEDRLDWYENLDGKGNFSSAKLIAGFTDGAKVVYAADIDKDGDMDIVHASLYKDNLTWYENNDGLGNFISRFIISDVSEKGIWSVFPGDVDGDGNLDLFYSYYYDDKIVWFENLNGLGDFGSQQIIDQNIIGPQSVKLNDLDGDGDLDIISAIFLEDKIVWYENLDGNGNFGSRIIINSHTERVRDVFTIDLDGDNDVDILSASMEDNKISWFENLDGEGDFSGQIIISENSEEASKVYAEDLDNDGDMDVISVFGDSIAWHENLNGQGEFGMQQIISSEMNSSTSAYASDLDGDGDIDVLSSSWYDGKIAWYENLSPLTVNENSIEFITIFPNPTNSYLNLETGLENIETIKIINLQGLIVKELNSSNKIDVSNLASGMYFIQISSEGRIVTKKFIKN